MTDEHHRCDGKAWVPDDADREIPLGQEDNLDLIGEHLAAAIDPLSSSDGGLALIAAGLELLPAGRCIHHYRDALLDVRGEVDRLLGAVTDG